jgi:hypothetical protein
LCSCRSLIAFALAQQHEAQPRRPGEGQHQRGEQRRGHGDGQRAEEAAGDAADRPAARKTTTGVMVEPISGVVISLQRLAHGIAAALAAIAVQHDVLHHHDGVVDHQADGGGQAAQRHQVEALADQPQHQHGDRNGDRNDQAGNQRGGPVAQEEKENDAGQDQSDEDGVAHAGDAVAHQLRLIVKGSSLHAGGSLRLSSATCAATASATATVLLDGWREMLRSTASLPLAVTVV